MFDQQHRHIGGQVGHGLQQFFALARGHTGHRFVQQKHLGFTRQGNGNLQQAAFAIGQVFSALGHHIGEVELFQQLTATLSNPCFGTQALPPAAAQPPVLRHHQRQCLQRRHGVEQLVDLEGAHHAPAHPLVGCDVGDVFAVQHNAPFRRLQHAGEQVDECGFARAIGANERMARAFHQVERDVAGGGNAAKTFDQALGAEHHVASLWVCGCSHRAPPLPNQVQGRIRRSRPTITSTTRNRPSQKVQYCGVIDESRSCMSLNTMAPITPP